ncbi:MAG: hypothetical protein QXQ31_02935 [Zestosphaera sp.]
MLPVPTRSSVVSYLWCAVWFSILEYMVNTITSIVDPIVGREYTRLIKRVCREMGPTAVFYPRLLLKSYENGISEELKYYILASP